MEQKTKKIILVVVCGVCLFAAGFVTSGVISKYRYTKSTNKLEQLLGDGYDKSRGLYEQLEQRLKELEVFRGQVTELESTVNECNKLVNQSEFTIKQLQTTIERSLTKSEDIGETIKQIRKTQFLIKEYINQIEENNFKLEEKLNKIKESGIKPSKNSY